MLLYVLLV